MKTTFLQFLTWPGPTLWPQKAQIRNSLNNILVQKDNHIIITFMTLRLTKVKFLKIISFLPFLMQIGQKFGPKLPSNVAFLAIFGLNFYSGVCTTTTFCFNMYSPCEIWKKTIDNAHFSTFFHNIGPNLSQIFPQDHTHFDFFCWFPIKYVRGFY